MFKRIGLYKARSESCYRGVYSAAEIAFLSTQAIRNDLRNTVRKSVFGKASAQHEPQQTVQAICTSAGI